MRESRSFCARWSRRKLESKMGLDIVEESVSSEQNADEEPAVPALTDADMPALETLQMTVTTADCCHPKLAISCVK